MLYTATYRDGETDTQLFPFADFDQETLIQFLDQNNSKLIIRSHLLEKGKRGSVFP
ncbi:hypothetical protein [Pollutimonas bauzanensis]|uniref:hypothetical protein n=1 Tax=Pollutimonas bauzanensis TaxID=658167 RepID=UPI003CCB8A41